MHLNFTYQTFRTYLCKYVCTRMPQPSWQVKRYDNALKFDFSCSFSHKTPFNLTHFTTHPLHYLAFSWNKCNEAKRWVEQSRRYLSATYWQLPCQCRYVYVCMSVYQVQFFQHITFSPLTVSLTLLLPLLLHEDWLQLSF